mmetsp:Transcript_13089/g.28682  ORF Transcript_13089/g.28682 Transcript_13089/m.28682 type:complete len:86 (-) Transcript_13089:552-809(-)
MRACLAVGVVSIVPKQTSPLDDNSRYFCRLEKWIATVETKIYKWECTCVLLTSTWVTEVNSTYRKLKCADCLNNEDFSPLVTSII